MNEFDPNTQFDPNAQGPAPYSWEPDPATKDAQDNKLMAVLCYLGILWLVPLLMKEHEKSPFVKFHLNQGIMLSIIAVVGNIALSTVAAITSFVPGLGLIMSLVSGAFGLVTFVFFILGIINAAQGKMSPLPLVGNIYTFFK